MELAMTQLSRLTTGSAFNNSLINAEGAQAPSSFMLPPCNGASIMLISVNLVSGPAQRTDSKLTLFPIFSPNLMYDNNFLNAPRPSLAPVSVIRVQSNCITERFLLCS
jgi:hypothetical protein